MKYLFILLLWANSALGVVTLSLEEKVTLATGTELDKVYSYEILPIIKMTPYNQHAYYLKGLYFFSKLKEEKKDETITSSLLNFKDSYYQYMDLQEGTLSTEGELLQYLYLQVAVRVFPEPFMQQKIDELENTSNWRIKLYSTYFNLMFLDARIAQYCLLLKKAEKNKDMSVDLIYSQVLLDVLSSKEALDENIILMFLNTTTRTSPFKDYLYSLLLKNKPNASFSYYLTAVKDMPYFAFPFLVLEKLKISRQQWKKIEKQLSKEESYNLTNFKEFYYVNKLSFSYLYQDKNSQKKIEQLIIDHEVNNYFLLVTVSIMLYKIDSQYAINFLSKIVNFNGHADLRFLLASSYFKNKNFKKTTEEIKNLILIHGERIDLSLFLLESILNDEHPDFVLAERVITGMKILTYNTDEYQDRVCYLTAKKFFLQSAPAQALLELKKISKPLIGIQEENKRFESFFIKSQVPTT